MSLLSLSETSIQPRTDRPNFGGIKPWKRCSRQGGLDELVERVLMPVEVGSVLDAILPPGLQGVLLAFVHVVGDLQVVARGYNLSEKSWLSIEVIFEVRC